MCLFLGKNVDKFLEIRDTPASEELEQLFVAVTWLYNVDNVFSLRPRDTSGSRTSKLSHKCMGWVDEIQQLTTTDIQLAHSTFI